MKPKIPKLTKKKRRIWIGALKKLLNSYESKINLRCPLCEIAEVNCNENCDCPWYWFMGSGCETYAYKKFDCSVVGLRIHKDPRWVKLRVRQIPRWIKNLRRIRWIYLIKLYY